MVLVEGGKSNREILERLFSPVNGSAPPAGHWAERTDSLPNNNRIFFDQSVWRRNQQNDRDDMGLPKNIPKYPKPASFMLKNGYTNWLQLGVPHFQTSQAGLWSRGSSSRRVTHAAKLQCDDFPNPTMLWFKCSLLLVNIYANVGFPISTLTCSKPRNFHS